MLLGQELANFIDDTLKETLLHWLNIQSNLTLPVYFTTITHQLIEEPIQAVLVQNIEVR